MSEKITQPALLQFEIEYAKYVRKVNDVNSTRIVEEKLAVATIRDRMDGSVLHAMCIMGKVVGATSV